MTTKLSGILISLLIICSTFVWAQPVTDSYPHYLQVNGTGIKRQRGKQAKLDSITTVGGLVQINFTETFLATPDIYFKTSSNEIDMLQHRNSKADRYAESNVIETVLGIGKSFFIELKSRKNDTLVKKYQIFRNKAIPTVKLRSITNSFESFLFLSKWEIWNFPPMRRSH